MKNKKYSQNVFLLLIPTLICLLIFRNSMYPIVQSDMQSGFVLRYLNRFLAFFGGSMQLTQFAVRKMAHFTEYFVLGFVLTLILQMPGRKWRPSLSLQLFLLLAVPVIDETIQLHSSGRNSSIIDVWIDFAGCVAGLGLSYLIRHLWSRSRKPRL